MPTLSFKPQFEQPVKAGHKRHTIRATRKRPWREGDSLYMWISQRTASRRFLGYTKVSMIEDVDINLSADPFRLDISINGLRLSPSEADTLARADGFANMRGMYDFWLENNEMPFAGSIIHWRYPFEARPETPRLLKRRG